MDVQAFQKELRDKVHKNLVPIYSQYNLDLTWLDSIMKWKPIVLVIGSYSSGKSTLINEMLGTEVQRTGQAPTDDSFTVITNDGENIPDQIPGSTLVNDQRYPFSGLKDFGESLISHLCLKNVNSSLLENMAIIDTPGMIDSVSERERGYKYLDVIGELASMSDLIIMMFDPHKAGTVKESFSAIRNVLPGRTGEDKVVFVLSRIDECENISDLVRSYGTLCWNISQMTSRKDMPHVFLTYAPGQSRPDSKQNELPQEREDLKAKMGTAQAMQMNHILEHVDRKAGELEMVCEGLYNFSQRARKLLSNTMKWTSAIALVLAVLSYFLVQGRFQAVSDDLLPGLALGSLAAVELAVPVIAALITLALGGISYAKLRFPRLLKKAQGNPEHLVRLDSEYRKNLWSRMKHHVLELLKKRTLKEHLFTFQGNLNKVRRFIREDIKNYYSRIGKDT